MMMVFGFLVGVLVFGLGFSPMASGAERVDLFMKQLVQGPEAVTLSLSSMSSDELFELTRKAAPLLLREGESGRVMAGILEALAGSWEASAPVETISMMLTDWEQGPLFRWALIECVGARSGLFSDAELADFVGAMAGVVADSDDDGVVRRKAAITVGLLGPGREDVRAALVAGLDDDDLRVVEGSAYGLRCIGNSQNSAALVAALDRLRQRAAVEEKDVDDDFVDRQFANTLCQVALALGRQGGQGCADALGDFSSSVVDSGVKGPVLFSLSRMDDVAALPHLLANDYGRVRYLRKAARLLLGALTAEVLPAGVSLVDVIYALGEIKSVAAISELQQLTGNSDNAIALAAVRALIEINK